MNNLKIWWDNLTFELKRDIKSYYDIDFDYLNNRLSEEQKFNINDKIEFEIKNFGNDYNFNSQFFLFVLRDGNNNNIIFAEILKKQNSSWIINKFGK